MKLKRKIMVILLLIISAITMYSNVSQAFSGLTKDSVGTYVTGGYNDLMQRNNYCIQYGASLLHSNYTFAVANYIKIDGTKLIIDGQEINDDKSNAILAYIIGADYDKDQNGNSYYNYSYSGENYTVRQKHIWAYWNEWSPLAGKSSWYYDGNETWKEYRDKKDNIIKAAEEYANKVKAGIKTEASITSNNKTITSEGLSGGGEKVGPFKVTYTGNIKNIILKSSDGKEISSGITYYQDGKKVDIKDIKSGKEVFIINKSNKNISKINIQVSAETDEIYTAELWRLNGIEGQQNLLVANTKKEKRETVANIELNIKRQQEGNIKIHKQDISKKTALEGAEFKIFIGTKNEPNHWLSVDNTGAYVYTSSYEDAKVFKSNSDGNVEINNLRAGYKVSIFETKAPKGYDLKSQKGYDENNDRVWCNQKYYTITTDTQDDTITFENTKTGNIEIIKQDKTTSEKLSGAEFKISVKAEGDKTKNMWLKKNNDGTYTYTASFNDATSFRTTDGTCKIENLDQGKYFVYEVKAPKGYDIKAQDNYNSANNWVVCGSAEVPSGKTIQVKLNNAQLINIEGYVWVDEPQTKANDYNSLYDNSEKKITDNVTITLRKKLDNSEVAKATINKDTQIYRFEKIDYKKLNEYYVNFDYSGTNYKSYITVDAIFDKAEGSKALADNVPDYEKDLVGIATTYKGKDNESKYGLSYLATKFYNENSYTLENVNLGIKGLPDTPFTVSENLAYVDVKLKGYNYRYIYGGIGEKAEIVPTVKWQSKTDKECYTREFYPSDVLYENPVDKTQELQAYVTYRIDVTNNTNIDVPYLYQEKSLNVTRVLNKYDTNRYELSDNNWETTKENGIARMKDEYLQKQYYEKFSTEIAEANGISNEKDKNNKYAYITFKIKEDKIKELLAHPEGTIEEFPTTAHVTAFHKYTRIDSSWENNLTKTQTHYTREDSKQEAAPYLGIDLMEKNRTISGKVFEDQNSKTNGELVGNGMYDQNENKVQGVKVELGNYNANKEFVPTDLYEMIEYNNRRVAKTDEKGNLVKAVATTDAEGKYSFEGVVPGEYLIRYTYGDGTQKIVDSQGKELKEVSSNKYKSTIVTSDIRKVFETSYEPTKAIWYLGIKDNLNLAIDDLELRKQLSDGKYELTASKLQDIESRNITAQTAEISIPIHYTDKTEGKWSNDYPNELGYMNFGIIEIPRTRLNIGKKITYIKLTNQQGATLSEGNPATQNIAYTTDLDKKTKGGSTYVKVEVDNVYGGTLEIKYEITVENNSDLDYIEDNYYKYGDTENATEKKVDIKEIYDYLDPKLLYIADKETKGIETINLETYRNQVDDKIPAEVKQVLSLIKELEEENDLQFKEILRVSNIGQLSSSKGKDKNNSSKTITINAMRKLDTQEDDLEFINIAEITKIENDPITPANVELPQTEKTDMKIRTKIGITPKVTITITPPTGENRNMIYFVVGTIALVVVAGGIGLIRRKRNK